MTTSGLLYEVLRRSDGESAVSVGVGQLAFVPSQCVMAEQVDGSVVCTLLSRDGRSSALLVGLPEDVASRAKRRGCLWLFEFAPAGAFVSHELPVVSP